MPVTRTDALEAILLAMLDRLTTAGGDEQGNVDETTQEDVDAIAALADGDNLDRLVDDLNRSVPGPPVVHSSESRGTPLDNLDCGTGAGGFKYDNTCWRGGQGDSFAGHPEIPQHDEGGRLYSEDELKKLFEEHAQHAGNLKVQTMESSEPMKMVRFAGMEWRWAEGQLDRVVHDAARVHKVPTPLLDAVGHVTYTGQRDTDEAEWKKKFNDPTFVIKAAGGHQSIISWNGYTMGSWTMAHEAGHNFAEKVWGDVSPPRNSAYGKAQKLEPPVTEYGASARYEDFAEACKMYVKDKAVFKKEFPKKFAALDELIKSHQK